MSEINIGILGSCVSRDAFEVSTKNLKFTIPIYLSRYTVISSLSPPASFGGLTYNYDFSKNFMSRRLANDLFKTHFNELQKVERELDFLIIDFIDERHQNVHFAGTTLANSSAFRDFKEEIGFKDSLKFYDMTDSNRTLMTLSMMEEFTQKITRLVHPEKIILHKALWAEVYRKEDSTIEYLKNSKGENIDSKTHNKILNQMYLNFEKYINGLKTIQVKKDLIIGTNSHRWGIAPYHYIDEYYNEFINQLEAIVRE